MATAVAPVLSIERRSRYLRAYPRLGSMVHAIPGDPSMDRDALTLFSAHDAAASYLMPGIVL
jgi:hypothetical protein